MSCLRSYFPARLRASDSPAIAALSLSICAKYYKGLWEHNLTDDVGADYVLDGLMAALMLYRPDRDYIGDFTDDEMALFDSLPIIPDLVPEDEVWDAFMTLRSYIFVSADVPDEICRIIAIPPTPSETAASVWHISAS